VTLVPQTEADLKQLLQRVDEREKIARSHAVVYSLIPVVIAAVLLSFTTWQVYEAESKVSKAKKVLDDTQRVLHATQNALVRLNVQQPRNDVAVERPQPALEESAFGQLLRASAKEVNVSPDRPIYDFRLWVDGNADALNRIARVKYQFNHPTIKQPVQESSDRASKFSAGYRGWGCLRSVIVTFTLVDSGKNPPPVDFDMCANLHWD
jgi:hypothetical protein